MTADWKKNLDLIFSKILPEILFEKKEILERRALFVPNKDFISLMRFGMPQKNPSFSKNFIEVDKSYLQNFVIDDLFRYYSETDFSANWTALSVARQLALSKIENPNNYFIDKTFLVTISDNLFSTAAKPSQELERMKNRNSELPINEAISGFYLARNICEDINRLYNHNNSIYRKDFGSYKISIYEILPKNKQ